MRRAIFVAAAVSLVSTAPAFAGGPGHDHRHGHGWKAFHRVSYAPSHSKGPSRQKNCNPHGVPAPELAAGVPAALAALGALGALGATSRRRRVTPVMAS